MPRGSKPGRAPTSGTRHGRGKGLWGPAKGEGNKVPFSSDDEYRGAHNAAAIRAKIADREEILGFYTDVLRDAGEATLNRLTAGDKILDRIEGKPVAKTLLGGAPDAGPFRVILEDLTDAEPENPAAVAAAGED